MSLAKPYFKLQLPLRQIFSQATPATRLMAQLRATLFVPLLLAALMAGTIQCKDGRITVFNNQGALGKFGWKLDHEKDTAMKFFAKHDRAECLRAEASL